MATQKMTEDQLKDHIDNVVGSILEDRLGSDIKQVVSDSVEEALQKDPKDNPVKQLVDDAVAGKGSAPKDEPTPTSKGSAFGCYIRAIAAAEVSGEGRHRAAEIAEQLGRPDVAEKIKVSKQKALDSGDATAGGFIVPTEFSSEIIEFLRASGVVRRLNPMTIRMGSGTFKIPRVAQGTSASYIGENENVEKTEPTFGQLTLSFKKLAALTPISNDLVRYASPDADTIVRNDVVQAMAAAEDLKFIRGDGLDGEPKGIRNWTHGDNKFDANTSLTVANVAADLGKCLELLMDANINLIVQQGTTESIDVRPGWIFHPQQYRYLTTLVTADGDFVFRDEMGRGTLFGFPFQVTTQMNDDEVIFGAFGHAVIGEAMGMSVDASQSAAYYDGSSVQAAYSLDQTVIRVIAEHDFAVRHDKAFSLIDSVTWGD